MTVKHFAVTTIVACLAAAGGLTRPAAAARRAPAAAVSGSDAWTLSGRVTDPDGHPIAQAGVRVVELRRTATSDNDGKYSIPQIPPGSYTISFRVIGYAPRVRKVTVGGADA